MNVQTKYCVADNYISVIMPVYNQASFIKRAIFSLLNQTFQYWELIIINDGSTDDLEKVVSPFLNDKRIELYNNDTNEGLGYSLNKGISYSKYNYIAYLPADDLYYKDHLKSLLESIDLGFDFAHAGMVYDFFDAFDNNCNFGKKTYHAIENMPFQLVQVLHRKTSDEWIERKELETDDLGIMFWNKYILNHNGIIGTREITCEWGDHPRQRHKIMNEYYGGSLNLFKKFYGINKPIRFENSYGEKKDEIIEYEPYRQKIFTEMTN